MPPSLKPFKLKTDAQVRRAMQPSVVKVSAREEEKAIQGRIIEALEALGCLVERRGEAGGRGGKGGGAFKTGEPDLRVSYRGRTFGIEVKRSMTEELRPKQIEWYQANSKHVPYFVVCSHEQAVEAFRWIRDCNVHTLPLPFAKDCRVEPHEAWVVLR